MKSKISKIKRTIVFFLIFLLSVNNFAAVISDNDGSNFITKGEFDSIKSEFQSQINDYNTSIDNKIDGAIAQYLAGVIVNNVEPIEIPVSNYDEMRWKRKWDVYGNYVEYTSPTSGTVHENVWYTPWAEKVRTSRYDYQINRMSFGRQYGTWALELDGVWDFTNAEGFYASNKNPGAPKPFLIFANGDDDNISVEHQFSVYTGVHTTPKPDYTTNCCMAIETSTYDRNSWGVHGSQYMPVYWNNGNWNTAGTPSWKNFGSNYDWADYGVAPIPGSDVNFGDKWLQPISGTIPDRQILNHYFYGFWQNGCIYMRIPLTMTFDEAFPFTPLSLNPPDTPSLITNSKKVDCGDVTNFPTAKFFATPKHYMAMHDNMTEQYDDLWYLALGTDFDTKVNIARLVEGRILNESPQLKMELSEWDTLVANFNKVYFGGGSGAIYQKAKTDPILPIKQTYTGTSIQSVDYKMPFLEQTNLATMTSKKFLNNGVPLKFGSGLPIIEKVRANGVVNIDLRWVIERSIGSLPTNQNIVIDIKNKTFLDTAGTFLQGRVDGGSLVSLSNYELTNTSKTTKISIDVKKGESVWIRVAPKSTDGGVKARLANLTAELVLD